MVLAYLRVHRTRVDGAFRYRWPRLGGRGVIFIVMGMSVVLVPGARMVLIHVVHKMRDGG